MFLVSCDTDISDEDACVINVTYVKRVKRYEFGREILFSKGCYVSTSHGTQDVIIGCITSLFVYKSKHYAKLNTFISPPANVYGLLHFTDTSVSNCILPLQQLG